MTVLSKFAGAGRAAVVALVLGATALTAVPAQAQPSFGFSFGTNGGGVYVDPGYGRGRDRDRDRCDYWSERDISRYLRARGYRDISVRGRGRYVTVYAREGRYYYEIEFDACRGRIIDRDRVRR